MMMQYYTLTATDMGNGSPLSMYSHVPQDELGVAEEKLQEKYKNHPHYKITISVEEGTWPETFTAAFLTRHRNVAKMYEEQFPGYQVKSIEERNETKYRANRQDPELIVLAFAHGEYKVVGYNRGEARIIEAVYEVLEDGRLIEDTSRRDVAIVLQVEERG
jgi:hypothetical protein